MITPYPQTTPSVVWIISHLCSLFIFQFTQRADQELFTMIKAANVAAANQNALYSKTVNIAPDANA